MTEQVVFSGNSTAEVSNSRITNDTGPVLVMNTTGDVSLNACVIDGYNNPIITGNGKGALKIDGCTFPKNTHIDSTVNPSIVGSVKAGCLEVSPGQVKIFAGMGPPTEVAPKGSLYLRTDGYSSSTRVYVNLDGGYEWTYVQTGK